MAKSMSWEKKIVVSIEHIQKRMRANLRSHKNIQRGVKLKDGKGVGGKGRLSDIVIDKMQTYYGYAIRNNIGNHVQIKKAVLTIFYHMVRGLPYELVDAQYKYCPKGNSSWCKTTYDRTKCLTFFRGELRPIFDRL